MSMDYGHEPSPFRVTLFVGPQTVEGKPFTHCCVFNVKKRSWKGGVQVAVEITEEQIEAGSSVLDFPRWLAAAQAGIGQDEVDIQADRARELFIQALCWCRLEARLQAGLTQENQTIPAAGPLPTWRDSLKPQRLFITSYVATELDLVPREDHST